MTHKQKYMLQVLVEALKTDRTIMITKEGYRLFDGFFECDCCKNFYAVNPRPLQRLSKEDRLLLIKTADSFDVNSYIGDCVSFEGASTDDGVSHCGCQD